MPQHIPKILVMTCCKESFAELHKSLKDADILIIRKVLTSDVDGSVDDLHDKACIILIAILDLSQMKVKVFVYTNVPIQDKVVAFILRSIDVDDRLPHPGCLARSRCLGIWRLYPQRLPIL